MANNRYDNPITYQMYSWIFGYNERRFWKYRQKIVDKNDKTPKLIKRLWLIYLKRSEAKNACSLGTAVNAGAIFDGVPELPHGIAGIFISHGAHIGRDCCILQNVTIGSSKGKAPKIGNNCVIGAGAVIVGADCPKMNDVVGTN